MHPTEKLVVPEGGLLRALRPPHSRSSNRAGLVLVHRFVNSLWGPRLAEHLVFLRAAAGTLQSKPCGSEGG